MCCCCKEKQIVKAEKGPKAIGPYSVGVKAGGFLYTAGQIGLDPESMTLVEGGVEAEARQALKNLSVILDAAGSGFEDVVKTTVFLKDMNDFNKVNAIYGEFFTSNPPARSAVAVAALPKGALVEIEAVAYYCKKDECDCTCDSEK
jgi:2-iminobutanoate/2-iminopropanoate deaminase